MYNQNSIYDGTKADSEKETVLFTQLCGSLMCDSLIWFRTDIPCVNLGARTLLVAGCHPDATPLQPNRAGSAAHGPCLSCDFTLRPLFSQQTRIIVSGAYLTVHAGHAGRLLRNCTNGVCHGLTESGANAKPKTSIKSWTTQQRVR